MIALTVRTDGRRACIERTIPSLDRLQGPVTHRVIVDDSGDPKYGAWLRTNYSDSWTVISHPERWGLGASLRDAWAVGLAFPDVDCILDWEDDFVLTEPVDLARIAKALDDRPTLAELTLKRTPYSVPEHRAGGYMEACPDHFTDATVKGFAYVRHTQMFYFNPSLIPRRVARWVAQSGVPIGEESIGSNLVAAGYHFGVVGKIADAPRVEHIGAERTQGWKP